jgi:hypothetical protein
MKSFFVCTSVILFLSAFSAARAEEPPCETTLTQPMPLPERTAANENLVCWPELRVAIVRQAADALIAYAKATPADPKQGPYNVLRDFRIALAEASACKVSVTSFQWWYPAAVVNAWRAYASRTVDALPAELIKMKTLREKCDQVETARGVVYFAEEKGAVTADLEWNLGQIEKNAGINCP